MQDVGRVNVLETAKDLVDEGLEVSICQWLTTTDDGGQIALHQLFIQIDLVVAGGAAGDVHVEETCDLRGCQLLLNGWTRGRWDRRCGGL